MQYITERDKALRYNLNDCVTLFYLILVNTPKRLLIYTEIYGIASILQDTILQVKEHKHNLITMMLSFVFVKLSRKE
jgi:hypothetical protein